MVTVNHSERSQRTIPQLKKALFLDTLIILCNSVLLQEYVLVRMISCIHDVFFLLFFFFFRVWVLVHSDVCKVLCFICAVACKSGLCMSDVEFVMNHPMVNDCTHVLCNTTKSIGSMYIGKKIKIWAVITIVLNWYHIATGWILTRSRAIIGNTDAWCWKFTGYMFFVFIVNYSFVRMVSIIIQSDM